MRAQFFVLSSIIIVFLLYTAYKPLLFEYESSNSIEEIMDNIEKEISLSSKFSNVVKFVNDSIYFLEKRGIKLKGIIIYMEKSADQLNVSMFNYFTSNLSIKMSFDDEEENIFLESNKWLSFLVNVSDYFNVSISIPEISIERNYTLSLYKKYLICFIEIDGFNNIIRRDLIV